MAALARILTVATTTVREAIRSRLLYTLLFFAVFLIVSGVLLSTLSYVERDRILQDVGFAAIRIFGVAIAVFVGVGLIHKEVDRRTVYTILSKPLSRAEFLLGKFTGLLLAVWLQLAVMMGVFVVVCLASSVLIEPAHLAAFLLIGVELALMVAVATFFSSFTTPLLASLFSMGIWVLGNMTRDLRDIGAHADLQVARTATVWLYHLLPDLDGFNLRIEAVHRLPFGASDVWLPLLYGIGYCAVVLVAAVAVFERRDFR